MMNKHFFALSSVCAVALAACADSGITAVAAPTPAPVASPAVTPAAAPVAAPVTSPKTKKVAPKAKAQPKSTAPVQQQIKKTEKVISTETIIS